MQSTINMEQAITNKKRLIGVRLSSGTVILISVILMRDECIITTLQKVMKSILTG